MSRLSYSALSSLFILVSASFPAAAAPPDSAAWHAPSCRQVTRLPSVTFTSDEGATLANNARRQAPNTSTFGVAALESPNRLLAELDGTIYLSKSAGCRWSRFATAGAPLLLFAPAEGGVAYAWSFLRGYNQIWRIDTAADPSDPARQAPLPSLPADVLTAVPDPAVPGHVRAVGGDAQIYDSFDGGRWTATGTAAPAGDLSLVYFAAVDPNDLGHVVVGMSTTGVWSTSDAGRTWTQATGLSSTGGPRNAFSGAISAADGAEVFVMSLDLDESDAGAPSQGRHIYRSGDGGASFASVVDQGGDVTLTNGPLLVTHPTLAGVLYFTFGSRFLDPPGSFLYRYDASTGQITRTFTTRATGLRAIAFNRADPDVIYLGLER